jgi:hypothetical protein
MGEIRKWQFPRWDASIPDRVSIGKSWFSLFCGISANREQIRWRQKCSEIATFSSDMVIGLT